MNTRPKIPANARNLNACVIGSSGSGKTRFWLTPQLLQAHSSYVVVDPKGGTLDQCGRFPATGEIQGAGVQQYRLFKIHALQSAGLYQDGKRCFEIRYCSDRQHQGATARRATSSGPKLKPSCTAPLWPTSSLRGRRKNAT